MAAPQQPFRVIRLLLQQPANHISRTSSYYLADGGPDKPSFRSRCTWIRRYRKRDADDRMSSRGLPGRRYIVAYSRKSRARSGRWARTRKKEGAVLADGLTDRRLYTEVPTSTVTSASVVQPIQLKWGPTIPCGIIVTSRHCVFKWQDMCYEQEQMSLSEPSLREQI